MDRIVVVTGSTPSGLLKPGYLARRIFTITAGKEKTGASIEVYS